MSETIYTKPLTPEGFAPFGDVLEVQGTPDKIINQGLCGRFHDRAQLAFKEGRAGISLFDAHARTLPYRLEMMERHPLGSQAFIPMHQNPFLVIVAEDAGGVPAQPKAFVTCAGQGINIHQNIWHGVLTPLDVPGLFAVVDCICESTNLQEHWFDAPYTIVANEMSQH